MTQFNAPTYNVQRPTGQCAVTGRAFEPGETFIAALIEIDPDEAATQPQGEQPKPAARSDKPSDPSPQDDLGLRRVDISLEAWENTPRPDRLFSYWKTTQPEPTQKKKLFVDDDVLLNLFRRLADTDQPQRLAFRFVLALILMRKKLLRYEGTRKDVNERNEPVEHWIMKPKGEDETLAVLNPHLDEQQIQQVTEQLGEILEAEL
jgi:hypothetical protein